MGNREIEALLAGKLQQARTAFENARNHFKDVTSDIPSGLPYPDGTQRIKNVGNAYQAAINAYALALHRFNSFLINGTAPEQLTQPSEKKKTPDCNK